MTGSAIADQPVQKSISYRWLNTYHKNAAKIKKLRSKINNETWIPEAKRITINPKPSIIHVQVNLYENAYYSDVKAKKVSL